MSTAEIIIAVWIGTSAALLALAVVGYCVGLWRAWR
jgi:hypothetical protein